jgi:hypothetical protein
LEIYRPSSLVTVSHSPLAMSVRPWTCCRPEDGDCSWESANSEKGEPAGRAGPRDLQGRARAEPVAVLGPARAAATGGRGSSRELQGRWAAWSRRRLLGIGEAGSRPVRGSGGHGGGLDARASSCSRVMAAAVAADSCNWGSGLWRGRTSSSSW